MADIDLEKVRRFRNADLRARQLVDAAIAIALTGNGEPTDHDYRRFAHDVALIATTALLKHVYENDAELVAIRAERDHYKKLAEEGLALHPLVLPIVKEDPPSSA